jgi:3-phytase
MRPACLIAPLVLLSPALHAQARVSPVFATGVEPDANVDSCAVWSAPGEIDSLLFVTEKDGDRIEVWNASTGARYAPRPFLGETPESSLPGDFDRPNGVWVIYHVPHAAGFADVLLVTDQENLRVQVFRLPDMEYFGELGTGEVGKGYGIAPYHDGTDLLVFITDNIPPAGFPGKIKKYRLRPDGAGLGGDLLSATGSSAGNPPLPNVESVVADHFHDRLHVCGDEGGSRNFIFRLDGSYTGVAYGDPQFEFNQEGINLYDTGGGRGYLLVSDQHTDGTPNEFEIFDRATIAHIGAFTSPPGGAIVTKNTDGAYLEQRPFPGFPNGAFFAVNDDVNAHAYDWTDIAAALGLEIVPLDRSFPGRAAGGAAGAGRALWFHDGSWWGALPRGGELVISRLEDGTFSALSPLGDEAPAAVWSSGGELAVLEAGESAAVHRLRYEPSLRRYAAAGDAVAVAAAVGPLADLAVEAGPAGEPLRGWVAWVSGGVLRVVSSGEGLDGWDPAGVPLGDAAAVTPSLFRMAGATGIAWVDAGGVRLRLHRDEDPAGAWQPAETVSGSAAAAIAAAALSDGRIIAAGSSALGAGWIRVRSAAGAWSDRSLAGDVRQVALSIDAARVRAHLFHGVEVAGRRVLHHRDADLGDLIFGPNRLAAGWPGVDIEAVSFAAEIPPEATDAVAAAFGDDGLGLVARVPLPGGEDRTPPITLQHSPPPGAAAAEGTELYFRITDDRSGVDRSRLELLVNGEAVSPTVRGVPRNLIVTYVLPPGLGATASIRIEAADLAAVPRIMVPFEYTLSVIGGGAPRFRRGDANGDERIDVSDGVRALLVLFAGVEPPACRDVLDVNDDGRADLTDPIALLDHIFRNGPTPPAPGASCGVDPTEDDLPCPAAAPCG